jgi:hypothetical protein
VVPPFPAPPTDRNRRGVWIGLIVGLGALMVCFAGGIFGIGLVVVAFNDQQQQQGKAAVSEFLGDVQGQRFTQARTRLCADKARATSAEEIRREFGRSGLRSFTPRTVTADTDGLHVDTDLTYDAAPARTVVFLVVQEGTDDTGALYKVCDWR